MDELKSAYNCSANVFSRCSASDEEETRPFSPATSDQISDGRVMHFAGILNRMATFINYCVHGVLTMRLSKAFLGKIDKPVIRQ